MFQIEKHKDNFGREYDLVSKASLLMDDPRRADKITKVFALILTYDSDDYLPYCKKAVKNQVDKIFELNEESDDLSRVANKLLNMIPKNSWVFYVNPDEILYDLPDNYLGALAHFLEKNKIYCADIRFPDFIYNYGTLFAGFDWGEGPGNYWTARRLFKWTGKEKFIHKTHFNISNMTEKERKLPLLCKYNNEHTNEWKGIVAKLPDVKLFHYGKLRGVERQRGKGERLLNGELMAKGIVPTIPYHGKHPSVMGL